MAQGAGDAHAGQPASAVDPAPNADDGIQPQQFERYSRIREVDFVGLQCRDNLARQCLDIDFEPDGQRGGRGHFGEDFVHPQYTGPELLVAKCLVAKDRTPETVLHAPPLRPLSSPCRRCREAHPERTMPDEVVR